MSTQSLGTLYVKLAADATALLSGFAKASMAVKEYANQVKEMAEPLAGAAAAVTAMGAASVALAASVDDRAFRSMSRLRVSTELLAVQVSDVLEPAVKSLAEAFTEAANFVARLDPLLKENIATWALWVVGIGAAAKAVAILASVLAPLATIVSWVASALASIGAGPIALAAAVVLLRKAWVESWGGIQDKTESVAGSLSGTFQAVGDTIYRALTWPIVKFLDVVMAVIDAVAKLNNAIGRQDISGLSGIQDALKAMQQDVQTGQFFSNAIDYAKSVASATGDVIAKGFNTVKAAAMKALGIGASSSASTAVARQPNLTQWDMGTVGQAGGVNQSGGSEGWVASVFAKSLAPSLATGKEIWVNSINSVSLAFRNVQTAASRVVWADVIASVGPTFDAAKVAMEKLLRRQMTFSESTMLAVDALSGSISKYPAAVRKALKTDDLSRSWGDLTESQRTIGNMMRRLGQQILGNMGALGATVSNIAQGAKAGGFWGAIIAAFLELGNRMTGFQRMLKFFEQGLQVLADAIGPLIGWVFDFVSQITAVQTQGTVGAIGALKPLFEGLADVFSNLAPIFGMVMNILKLLEPVLNAFGKAIGAILKALGPVIKIIFEIVKYIVVWVGGVIGVILQVINWVEQFLGWIIELFGNKKAADEMRANMTDMDAYWETLKDLEKTTWDQQAAADAATTSSWDAAIANKELAATTASVTEQLLNVPSGYKIAYARYSALVEGLGGGPTPGNGGSGSGDSGGGSSGVGGEAKTIPGNVNSGWSKWKPAGNTWTDGSAPAPSINVNGDVNIDVSGDMDAERFVEKINQSNRVRNAQATGSWYQRRGG